MNKVTMIDLFNREQLISDLSSGIWKEGNPCFLLTSSFIIRFLIFWIMVNTPVPCGVFAAAVVIGGLIGRDYAEIGNMYLGLTLNRRMCAVAGAAAFSGVISKTTSPILILLEMTGEMNYLFPLIITVVTANAVAGVYTMSFFDTVLNVKK
jgi:H+/Cl- antiporter ClcA